jgi:ribosomal protein S18 acetylase RimI-like enzyme
MTISLADIVLRSFTPNDIPIILEKHKLLYAKEFNYPPESFGKYVSEALDSFLATKDGAMWIAEYPSHQEPSLEESSTVVEGGRIWAGCIAIVPTDERTGRLRFLLIEPMFRSCGLGRRLMDTALEHCAKHNFGRVTLSTAGDCLSARRLYERYGFKIVKVAGRTEWGGITDEWWEKPLNH